MSIALPAALALAADPVTSLVDTAFVGHIGIACSLLIIQSRESGLQVSACFVGYHDIIVASKSMQSHLYDLEPLGQWLMVM